MEYLFFLVLTILASAFFSGVEFAFISSDKLGIELKKQGSGVSSKLLSLYFDKPSHFLTTTLVGNNIALTLYGMTMSVLLEPILKTWGMTEIPILLLQTLISTTIILIFGEFIPKNLFRLNPNGILYFIAIPFAIIYGGLWIVVVFVVFFAKFILTTFFNLEYHINDQKDFEKIDLQHFLKKNQQQTTINSTQTKTILLEKALDLNTTKIRECMVPRTEIIGVDKQETIENIKKLFIESKHSKLIVYHNNIDHIIGYLHHQDILRGRKKVWQIMVVPETMPAIHLLNSFIKDRKTIAYVADEFGGTAGIVTLEDIIEEIFGEIRDEHDDEKFVEEQLSDTHYRFSAQKE